MQYARDKWSSLPLAGQADFITDDIRFSCYSLAAAGYPWLVVSKQHSPFLLDLSCKIELDLYLVPRTKINFENETFILKRICTCGYIVCFACATRAQISQF